ncbi:hypothetical protein [Acinetobacter pollinis]|uniref:hypothetical protein n=1 Tax=Acinetobacter pollinis TaxID=2605270 RepID=UPI0018A2D2B8|nr:hypothetical protein [Acinetobacter pollinis]MBF7699275.1 hypothetical protein [Acinetobacter pollinis]
MPQSQPIKLENEADKVHLKIAYLTFLQNIINRLSTIGITIKTASVTTLIALLAYSASSSVNASFKLLWLFFIPWLFFYAYDAYFLRLERTFRNIYNNNANEEYISFEKFKINGELLKKFRIEWSDVIFSSPILPFHLTVIVVIIIAFLNIKGIPCT